MKSDKLALRRFALEAPNTYTKRTAKADFTRDFLGCFGWSEETLPAPLAPSLKVVNQGDGETRKVGLWWPERRVLIEVMEPYVDLSLAWGELAQVCIQLNPAPQYVVFSNRRDIQFYELKHDKDKPRLSISLDELAKHSESFAFLAPDWSSDQSIHVLDVDKLSRDVADRVAKVYRQLIERGVEEDLAVRFVLQCIIAMFAEDIGLLPKDTFTKLLYNAKANGDAKERLHELFWQMSTPATSAREIPYFNGGLFAEPVALELNAEQLDALTRASEADWSQVDPHIFGSVFQGIMGEAERHSSGAHYTARDAIMRVVDPTIIEPWRQRINAASTLEELLTIRRELSSFRVLDPACGSGNFLYVSFRELYKLETTLLGRIHKYATGQKVGWGSGIVTTNFYGIDTNHFAVELARTTLNIAKKIAFDERKEAIAQLYGQVELSTDPSLPLDNLSANIIEADALFTDWPEVDAIVGNPPFLGGQKIRSELGDDYVERLKARFSLGVLDLCAYWFRRAHDHLKDGSRAGLVATSGIRVGKARRAALDYLIAQGGTITAASSSRPWEGDAVVHVSIINWIKGEVAGPYHLEVNGAIYERARIPTHLRLDVDVSEAQVLKTNASGTSMGVIFADSGFQPSPKEWALWESPQALSPIATGGAMLDGKLATKAKYCLDFRDCETEEQAKTKDPALFEHLRSKVYQVITEKADKERLRRDETGSGPTHYMTWERAWWKPQQSRDEFFRDEVRQSKRIIACSNTMARPIYCFLSTKFVPTNTMQMFAFEDDYSFGVIQSSYHWRWTWIKGGRLEERIRYTVPVWATFPWPQAPSEEQVVAVAHAARALRETRARLMEENKWSLRELYQASEVEGPHPLKDAQDKLDAAVGAAYGHPGDQEIVEYLLELNGYLAEDEAEGLEVQGPGLPKGFDPADARWMSDDCIQPPALTVKESP